MLTLVIKADPFVAFAMATIHDITGLELAGQTKHNETLLKCPDTPEHQIECARWMTEEPRQAPFPIGALLFYSFSTPQQEPST